jgi:ubiquinone/menaquinone biosynthesis C-methylase UbiE
MGIFLVFVANVSLWFFGKGANTLLLTRQLVVTNIYEWTRNPMSLGFYLVSIGAGLLLRSTTMTFGALFLLIPAHMFYPKYFEEYELEWVRHTWNTSEGYLSCFPILVHLKASQAFFVRDHRGKAEVEEYIVDPSSQDAEIIEKELLLREWFTRNCDPIQKTIDGLDIGWGGTQCWATARLPVNAHGKHLDFACGYATFLAQLGWRFPALGLVGLNIDFAGPHALAKPLLNEAGVSASLLRADARWMPFADHTFDSASCFLGLQDVEIGFGEAGVRAVLAEAVRVLCPDGRLVLLDKFLFERFDDLLSGLPVVVIDREECEPNVHWDEQVAKTAIKLYAEGWVAQMHLPDETRAAHQAAYQMILGRLEAKLEQQINERGYYVPFGTVRMVIALNLGN